MSRANRSGRAWVPISSRSRKPRVITSARGAPLRSRRAFVATVVPMRTSHGGIGASSVSSRISRMAISGARSLDRTLATWSRPVCGSRPMQSVNVPPRSIQNSQRMAVSYTPFETPGRRRRGSPIVSRGPPPRGDAFAPRPPRRPRRGGPQHRRRSQRDAPHHEGPAPRAHLTTAPPARRAPASGARRPAEPAGRRGKPPSPRSVLEGAIAEGEGGAVVVDDGRPSSFEGAEQDLAAQRLLHLVLDQAGQRTRAVLLVVALLGKVVPRCLRKLDRDVPLGQLLLELEHVLVDDLPHDVGRQGREGNARVEAVSELGAERGPERQVLLPLARAMAEAQRPPRELRGTHVARHDQNHVPEVGLLAVV